MKQIFFHEDDFCQIEILPIENYNFALKQAGIIVDFAKNHRQEIGFSDMYIRETSPISLLEKKISKTLAENTFNKNLEKYNEVYTGYGSYHTICKNIFAYGKNKSNLFFNVKENYLSNIWLMLDVVDEYHSNISKDIFTALTNLGDFIIADWSWNFVEKVDNTIQIEKYIEKRLEVFRR